MTTVPTLGLEPPTPRGTHTLTWDGALALAVVAVVTLVLAVVVAVVVANTSDGGRVMAPEQVLVPSPQPARG